MAAAASKDVLRMVESRIMSPRSCWFGGVSRSSLKGGPGAKKLNAGGRRGGKNVAQTNGMPSRQAMITPLPHK
jgi:hypothetical protein